MNDSRLQLNFPVTTTSCSQIFSMINKWLRLMAEESSCFKTLFAKVYKILLIFDRSKEHLSFQLNYIKLHNGIVSFISSTNSNLSCSVGGAILSPLILDSFALRWCEWHRQLISFFHSELLYTFIMKFVESECLPL